MSPMVVFKEPLNSSVFPATLRSGTRLPVPLVLLPPLRDLTSCTLVKVVMLTTVADQASATLFALMATAALVLDTVETLLTTAMLLTVYSTSVRAVMPTRLLLEPALATMLVPKRAAFSTAVPVSIAA